MSYFLIFVGGGLGAGSRFFLTNLFNNYSILGFASGTLIINILGCFFIGFLMNENLNFSKHLHFFFGIGFLGSFTTFSAFTKEAILFYEQIGVFASIIYFMMSIVICLLATYASYKLF